MLTRSEVLSARARVTVVPIASTIRGIPTEVRPGPSDGLKRVCVANADEILTIPKSLLSRRLVSLKADKVAALESAVRYALALE